MPRKFKNVTTALLDPSNVTTDCTPKPIAWGPPRTHNTHEPGSAFPQLDAAIVRDVIAYFEGDTDGALESMQWMQAEAVALAEQTVLNDCPDSTQSSSIGQVPIFMRPVRSRKVTPRLQIDEIPKDPVEPDPAAAAESPLEWMEKKTRRRGSSSHGRRPSSAEAATTAPANGKALREAAQAHREQMHRLRSQAAVLRGQGRAQEATRCVEMAERARANCADAHARAADAIFRENNPPGAEALDLHHLSVDEALARLAAPLPALAAAARRRGARWARVITGAGVHSPGGACVLEPAALRWLAAGGLRARRAAAGVVEVAAEDRAAVAAACAGAGAEACDAGVCA
jgi:DNA-nicking Smr family endonuclease